ncbi:hypothetical protein TKK_0008386 [Trichogramma kaykai]
MSVKQIIQSSTTVTSDECIYTWTIKNYRLIKSKVGEKIESPKFGVGSDDKKYFQLSLYPAGDTKERAEGYISLFLRPVIDSTNKSDKLIYKCTLSAINNDEVVQQLTLHDDSAIGKDMKKIDDPYIWVKLMQSIIKSQKNVS